MGKCNKPKERLIERFKSFDLKFKTINGYTKINSKEDRVSGTFSGTVLEVIYEEGKGINRSTRNTGEHNNRVKV